MKTLTRILFALAAVLVLSSTALAAASQIIFTEVTGTGSYRNGLAPLTDGFIPAETTRWSNGSTWSMGNDGDQEIYTFAMGASYLIQDVTLSVDNNDQYVVEYSNDGFTWGNLFTIAPTDGNISPYPGGMDTFSTDASNPEYVSAIDFSPVQAQFLRIYGVGNDYHYSVGEFQAFGTPTPIPGAVWLLGTGLAGLVGLRRRKRG